MQTWGVPNGNLKHTVQHADNAQTYRQYSMQTWGVPNGNLKHTVSTACRPGVFLTEISNIPSVQHAEAISNIPSVQHLGCS